MVNIISLMLRQAVTELYFANLKDYEFERGWKDLLKVLKSLLKILQVLDFLNRPIV